MLNWGGICICTQKALRPFCFRYLHLLTADSSGFGFFQTLETRTVSVTMSAVFKHLLLFEGIKISKATQHVAKIPSFFISCIKFV